MTKRDWNPYLLKDADRGMEFICFGISIRGEVIDYYGFGLAQGYGARGELNTKQQNGDFTWKTETDGRIISFRKIPWKEWQQKWEKTFFPGRTDRPASMEALQKEFKEIAEEEWTDDLD